MAGFPFVLFLTRLGCLHDSTLSRLTLLDCEFPVVAFAIWGWWLRPVRGHVSKHMSYPLSSQRRNEKMP